ncbi:hypothetical protein HQ563_01960 [bacterium]|nr:hypothetical protein [bacterium]
MDYSRCAVTIISTFAVVLLLNTALSANESKRRPVSAASTELFEIRNIEGWMVYIKKQDLLDHAADMDKAIEHLQNQLYQTRLAVPSPAAAIMQQRVPLWVEYDSDPGTAFHPSYKWLLERGYPSPAGLKSLVSIARAKNFCKFSLHQPWVILHELAHGYDYLYLGEGRHYSIPRIEAAHKRAKKSGIYKSVLCRYSEGTKHYGITNKMEYFTENSEAYFGTNDFYPFVRAELKEHDPDCYVMLQDLWGEDVQKQERASKSLAKFIESPNAQTAVDAEGNPTAYVPTSKYEKRKIEGWTVYVSPPLIQQKAYGDEMCKLLKYKLHLVKRYMPEKAIEQLRKVPIWLEKESDAVRYMTYHASAEKLKVSNQNPDKLHAVEIGNAGNFYQWQNLQPFMILNQLAWAYYDRVLGGDVPEIKTAWQRAIKSGQYDSVLRFDGKHVRHPALSGLREFFAEMTESYYGVNDHYPFLQFETRQHDLETCQLLAKLWGGKAK